MAELGRLRSAFEAATAGHGALLMVVGEPGIGKTALCDRFSTFVLDAGGKVLVGHCYEEGSFRLPYQPFIEVFEQYLQANGSDALVSDLGSGAADVVRLAPRLAERLTITPRPAGDPEEDRYRLLQAVTDLLRGAAAKQTLLLVLEDLHDADRETLDLLLHLARNLHGARLLVVATYRDVEVDRAHPLSSALSELYRASNVARLQLRGLSADEVQRLLAATTQQTVPQPFAELIRDQTEGNPLFVQETLHFVVDAGLVEQRDGALRRVGDQNLAGRIPEGLRDAVGKRLSSLSDSTNRVLSVASVIGREFELEILRQVFAGQDEEVEAALEEATAAAVLEERFTVGAIVTYRFRHAFFRQVLSDEMVAPRRIRLHQQVARALERVHAGRLETKHAAELAEHFAFSSDTGDLLKAVHYGELAARNATEMFAYGEAARQLERALVVQDVADPADRKARCDLLLALGESLWPTGDSLRVITHVAPNAFGLAESLGDRSRASRACQLALEALVLQGANAAGGWPEFISWAEQAHAYATPESNERVKASLALALVRWTEGRWQEVRALRAGALALARQLGNAEVLFNSAFWVTNMSAPQHWDEGLQLVDESSGWLRHGVTGRTLGTFLWMSGRVMLAEGNRARAEEFWSDVEELAARTQVATIKLLVPQSAAIMAVVDGRLEYALEILRGYVERADTLGASGRARFFSLLLLHTPLLYLGRDGDWLTLLEDYNRLVGPAFAQSPMGTVARAICLAQCSNLEEARALVVRLLDEAEGGRAEDEVPMEHLVALLRA
ncbi:MAG: AAA family ATPase, partial [Chloroflexi bacterium]|nr:AAA family ATPase [Chloroflexota bacterium]